MKVKFVGDTLGLNAAAMDIKRQILSGTGATVGAGGQMILPGQQWGWNYGSLGGGPPTPPPKLGMGGRLEEFLSLKASHNMFKLGGALIASRVAAGALRGATAGRDFLHASMYGSNEEQDAALTGLRESAENIDNRITGGLGGAVNGFLGRYNPGNAMILAGRKLKKFLPSGMQGMIHDAQTTGEMMDSDKALEEQEKKTNRMALMNSKRREQLEIQRTRQLALNERNAAVEWATLKGDEATREKNKLTHDPVQDRINLKIAMANLGADQRGIEGQKMALGSAGGVASLRAAGNDDAADLKSVLDAGNLARMQNVRPELSIPIDEYWSQQYRATEKVVAKRKGARQAELSSLQSALTGPSGFAMSFDPLRDATGSPDGDREAHELQGRMVELLEIIANNSDGGARAG